jgi:hypothetical protein
MINFRKIFISTAILFSIWSCEEVIDIDLNYADPAFVVEAVICKDSVCSVHLTKTASYFSSEEPEFIDDASITIGNGTTEEDLIYTGNGYYTGTTIIGTEGTTYEIEILHDGVFYNGTSSMPGGAEIISVNYSKSTEVTILNPDGELVFTILCRFYDDPETKNYYMISFVSEGDLIEERYFMLTEDGANGGSFDITGNMISFYESIFYQGGEVEIRLFTIDESTYFYFTQLDDILFWKRRYIPPIPYNPKSNISNGALGYFAAWAYDSRKIFLY